MNTFARDLEEAFPGAVRSADYLVTVRRTIEALGFRTERTLPLVSVCRDELTSPFVSRVESIWGPAFTLAGLGGVPALGRTGWSAAFAHVPVRDARGGVLVLGFPHVGMEADGTIGVTLRRGQGVPTPTCGALVSLFERAHSGDLPAEIDDHDYEATRLALRLVDPDDPPASLLELTTLALEALAADLGEAISESQIWLQHDVTVWCGVQVHGPGGDDWIWPRYAWFTGRDGGRRAIHP